MTARTLAAAVVAFGTLCARVAAAEIPDPMPPSNPDGGMPDGPSAVAPAPPAATVAPTPAPAPPKYTDQIDREQLRKLTWQDIVIRQPNPWESSPTARMSARWQSSLYGFVELNAMHDSTQSYGASANNLMLARPGTYAGLHGRTQMTANNSLFGFVINAPEFHRGLHPMAHLEMDFFGVQPSDATEQSLFSSPSVRMRLFYFRLKQDLFERAAIDLLVGQYHDLFAWGGAGFYPHSVAFLGIAGEVYHRNPQIRVTGTIPLCCVTIDVAAAAVRPVQRDSEMPDLQGGIKLSIDKWRGVGAQGFGQPGLQPLAIGVSGIWRRFAVAEFLPVPGDPKIGFGRGLAVNAFVPIIPARERPNSLFAAPWNRENALSLTAEVTIGTGISDLYTGLTGGALFPTLPNPSGMMPPPLYRPNIDSGIVTFDADGNLKTIDWRALVVGLQYYLPGAGGRVWVSANYSQLKSANILSLTPENSRGAVFYYQDYVDGNAYAALTPAVQLGLSYQYTHQVFGDRPFGGPHPESHNNRVELGFRFFF